MFSGILKNYKKFNDSQWDIDIRLETKYFISRILGYILKGNTSISGNIKVEYFYSGQIKNEIIHLEFSLISRLSKKMTYKAGDIKLYSTAYSFLNVVSALRYQHTHGHIELQLEVNTSPHLYDAEKHKLTAQFVVMYSKPYFQSDGNYIRHIFKLFFLVHENISKLLSDILY